MYTCTYNKARVGVDVRTYLSDIMYMYIQQSKSVDVQTYLSDTIRFLRMQLLNSSNEGRNIHIQFINVPIRRSDSLKTTNDLF